MLLATLLSAALAISGPPVAFPDTTRHQNLPGVTVRPGRLVEITPLAGKSKKKSTYVLLAGTKIAVHLPASAQGSLSEIRLQMEKRNVKVGSLRIQLLAAPSPVLQQVPEGPNLLDADLVYSAQQLSAVRDGELVIDISGRNIEMPQYGVVVVVEALGPADAPEYLSVSMSSSGHSPMVVTTGPDGAKVSHLNEWPTLIGATSVSSPRTWVLGSNGRGWTQRPVREKGIVYNSLVSVVVLDNSQAATKKR